MLQWVELRAPDATKQIFLEPQRVKGRQHLDVLAGLEDEALIADALGHLQQNSPRRRNQSPP